jgi:hypothetical protein
MKNPVDAIHEGLKKSNVVISDKIVLDPTPAVLEELPVMLRPLFVWLEKVEYYLYDSRLSGFGPLWLILFLPSIPISIIYAIKTRRYNFLLISVALIITFIIYPRNWNTRYVIFIVGLGAISFGVVLDYFSNREKMLKVIVLLLVLYTFLTANSPCITSQKVKEFISLPPEERTLVKQAPFNIDLHAHQEYGYWLWIARNISKDDILAYTFEPLFLSPLWNREFSNKVVFVKSDSYNAWLKKLRENKATYVLIRENSIEDKWIDKEKKIMAKYRWLGGFKERFKVVYADKNYKILKSQIR